MLESSLDNKSQSAIRLGGCDGRPRSTKAQRAEDGQLLPGSVIRHYKRGHLAMVLARVLLGVTWSVTWCYLGVTWRYLGFFFGVVPKISFFCMVPKHSRSSNSNFWEKRDFPWAHTCSRYLFTWPTLCQRVNMQEANLYILRC